jgi:tyrosyl-tRNA synthetase
MNDVMDVWNVWKQRGFVYQATSEASVRKHLSDGVRTIYCGYDPTAPSLQVGNLVPIMMKAHAQKAGHVPLVVAGGTTGLIGDPSGKSQERPLLTSETVAANVEAQKEIFASFLDFSLTRSNAARWRNNVEWLGCS